MGLQTLLTAQDLLKDVEIGPVMVHDNLSVAPLFGENRLLEDVMPLHESFRYEGVVVLDQGSIDSLQLSNKLDRLLFIPNGAILEGLSQNRAAQWSVLVPPLATTQVSVYCVEQGQPIIPGTGYNGSTSMITALLRNRPNAAHSVVDQQDAWKTIDRTMTSLDTRSATRSYVEIVQQADLGAYLEVFGEVQSGQIGYVAGVHTRDGIALFSDRLGNNGLYGKLDSMLRESVASAAAVSRNGTQGTGHEPIDKDVLAAFMDNARHTELIKRDERTVGEMYVMLEPVEGMALTYKGDLVHMSFRQMNA